MRDVWRIVASAMLRISEVNCPMLEVMRRQIDIALILIRLKILMILEGCSLVVCYSLMCSVVSGLGQQVRLG